MPIRVLSGTGDVGEDQKKSTTRDARQGKSSSSVTMPTIDPENSASANLPAPFTTNQMDMTENVCYGLTKRSSAQHVRDSSSVQGSQKHATITMTENVAYEGVSKPLKISGSDVTENVCY